MCNSCIHGKVCKHVVTLYHYMDRIADMLGDMDGTPVSLSVSPVCGKYHQIDGVRNYNITITDHLESMKKLLNIK